MKLNEKIKEYSGYMETYIEDTNKDNEYWVIEANKKHNNDSIMDYCKK